MTGRLQIRQLYPVRGDLFRVTTDGQEWWIDRVVLLALVQAENQVDLVEPITRSRLLADDVFLDSFLVFGPDRIPIGKIWKEVYR